MHYNAIGKHYNANFPIGKTLGNKVFYFRTGSGTVILAKHKHSEKKSVKISRQA